MPERLHVRLDPDLQRGIRTFARENGLTTSQATRDLLRQALGAADPVDRGWKEGFSAGYGEGQAAQAQQATKVAKRKRIAPWMTKAKTEVVRK